jgi:hypothetical protein
MNIGQTITLSSELGSHGDVAGPCAGRRFKVSEIGSGGIYETRVECCTCERRLPFYGDQILDPLAEALLEEGEEALCAVQVTYQFLSGKARGKISLPTWYFKVYPTALGAFESITQDAVCRAFRPVQPTDLLETATVRLFQRGQSDWDVKREHEFRYP